MDELKFELQIKFHTITDFSNHVRKIVSPYVTFASNLGFENINRPNERALLRFPDENYIISVGWNSLAAGIIGETSDLDKYEGQLRFVYDLLENIKKLDTFEGIEYTRFRTWDLLPNLYSDYDSFRNEFYSKKVPDLNSTNDCAVVVEGELSEYDISYSTTFGPLNYPEDIERHNLSLFNRSAFDEDGMESTEGCLVDNTLQNFKSSFDQIEIRKFLSARENIIDNIRK